MTTFLMNLSRFRATFSFFAAGLITLTSGLSAATSVSQYGITWTFDKDYPVGQFANGDYWVQGPVNIVSISPASKVVDGRTINGSMLNPKAGVSVQQGFDSSMTANSFSSATNAARPNGSDLSASNPLIISTPASLVSSISHGTAGRRPQLTDAAVLTVLTQAPPANAFRPPYAGTDKEIIATTSNLDFSKLRRISIPSNAPDLAAVTDYFKRPWIEINTQYGGGMMHPSNNQPEYGRDLAKQLSIGLLSLQLDYSDEAKRLLLIRLVQYGIDIYGSARSGGVWEENGGHNQGRKMPLLLSGLVLNNPSILAYADASKHFIFQEDRQTFFVSQKDVDNTSSSKWNPDDRNGPVLPYLASDIGLPDWGITHVKNPYQDNKDWSAIYRTVSGAGTVGHVLTAHLMGVTNNWNWSPIFAYYDRYMAVDITRPEGTNTPTQFERDLWHAHRNQIASTPASAPSNAKIAIVAD